jgi:PPIC-type PPIASE domain
LTRWSNRSRWAVSAAAAVIAALNSASSEAAPASNASDAGSAQSAANAVIASWKGGQITVADMQSVVAIKQPTELFHIVAPGGLERLLEDLVRYDLLVMEATRLGYAGHQSVVDNTRNAAIDAMLARDFTVTPEAIPQADVDAYWKEHGAKYQRPAVRRASLIQVANDAEAKALLQELRGADRPRFARTAVARSLDPRTRHQGGELGFFDSEGVPSPDRNAPRVPAALAQAVFSLRKVGDISARPIAHDGGFSLLMLTGEMEARESSLADMAGEIREQLAQQRTQAARDALLAQLREQKKPEVHAELVDAIVLETGPDLDIPQGFPAAPRDPREPAKLKAPDKY